MLDLVKMQEEAAKHGIELEITLKADGTLTIDAIKGQLGSVTHFNVGNLIGQRGGTKEWENIMLTRIIKSFERAEKGESVEDSRCLYEKRRKLLYKLDGRTGG